MSERKETSQGSGTKIIIAGLIIALAILLADDGMSYIVNEFITTESFALGKIEAGESYFYKNYTILENQEENETYLWRTGNTSAHIFWEVSNSEETEYTIIENCTVTDEGQQLTVRNRNRNDATDGRELDIYINTSFQCTNCEQIFRARYGAKKFNYGIVRSNKEIVLRPNEDYCFLIIDKSTSPDIVNVLFEWYEETSHQNE